MLIHSVQQYSQLSETCTCQSLLHKFLEDENLLYEQFCKSIRVHPELSVNGKRHKMTMVKDLKKVHNNAIDKEN